MNGINKTRSPIICTSLYEFLLVNDKMLMQNLSRFPEMIKGIKKAPAKIVRGFYL